jgi:hypothetical protein
MKIEILEKFCSRDETRTKIQKPFSIGDYTYATNGHIIIRIDKVESIGSVENSLNPETLLTWDHSKIKEWLPLPEYSIDISDKCRYCKGTGKSEDCPECEDEGFVEFSNAHNYYEVECKTCDGSGTVVSDDSPCDYCGGGGYNLNSPINFKDKKVNIIYLELIKDLPGIALSPAGDPMEPVRFKFDDGCGFIMPMKY